MKILFLGYDDSRVFDYVKSIEEEVLLYCDVLDKKMLEKHNPDFIISHGYRHIIKKDIVSLYKDKIINLHISYLPWNRGADPNFWSFIDNTPKGVTIHYIDEGIDTGDIIVQKEILFSNNETLRSSYDKLQNLIFVLFKENWDSIKRSKNARVAQGINGTFHKLADKNKIIGLLNGGWDTKVSFLDELRIK